jgi:hypothetical protein
VSDTVVHVSNDQVSVVATGAAVDGSGIVYLGVAGHQTAVKSVWATLSKKGNGRRRDRYLRTGWYGTGYAGPLADGGGGYVQRWTPLPQTNLHHLAILHRLALDEVGEGRYTYLLAWNAEGAALQRTGYHYHEHDPLNRRRDELAADILRPRSGQALPDLQARLVSRLDHDLGVPVLEEWAGFLWDAASEGIEGKKGLRVVTARGDCIAAYRVDLDWPWQETISRGLAGGRITF